MSATERYGPWHSVADLFLDDFYMLCSNTRLKKVEVQPPF